ncbi:hypothetical protein C5C36_12280 [Rathayibacter sp. AY1G1]|jgi:hypothetical protein|uniref:hypothetical protein n=2 Tax=Rathayibacter TaxID=33886 RepID=UPI000CE7AD05|nr:hypothetical protein [Rathayibacter sp. AY2B5]PPF18144.1 hypothetical protein C5B95_12640 [Rathayibacter sp. AY1A7]PPF19810.1 hypothetical protein C5B92_02160 [Rathayibacter sp. AY1A4]PPF28156.1 hypothetical protein C5C54_07750 [Rathayibacter sp. AY1F2]PPF41511.1 hypothetical protein C5B93_02095 [Rathayibacter sp. AY1A2]PPF71807.1 hypothetical protein C5C46_09120 [Rathayibacter sp. AY1E6]PPG08942.1 hypothetical protein C5C26_07505 [Rathayibacter sp. AY2B1]PPG14078.1 hypothetical protein C
MIAKAESTMTQISSIQPARWSRNGVRIVVVPGAELPRFRLEIDARLTTAPSLVPTGPFSTVEEAERAAEVAAGLLGAKIPA